MKLTVAGQLLVEKSHTDVYGLPTDDYGADTRSQTDSLTWIPWKQGWV